MITFREVSQEVILCRRGSFIIFFTSSRWRDKKLLGKCNIYRNKNPRLKIIAKFKITWKNSVEFQCWFNIWRLIFFSMISFVKGVFNWRKSNSKYGWNNSAYLERLIIYLVLVWLGFSQLFILIFLQRVTLYHIEGNHNRCGVCWDKKSLGR